MKVESSVFDQLLILLHSFQYVVIVVIVFVVVVVIVVVVIRIIFLLFLIFVIAEYVSVSFCS